MPKFRPRQAGKARSMEKLMNGQIYSMRKNAKTTNIPFLSLQTYTKKIKEPHLGRNTVFTPEIEK